MAVRMFSAFVGVPNESARAKTEHTMELGSKTTKRVGVVCISSFHLRDVERGFDFLGRHFSSVGLSVAQQAAANFIEKASRLYEHHR
jgi:hypothetical protein